MAPMSDPAFLWGTASSAHQVEGWNEHNDWWEFERRTAERSLAACDFANRFEKDLDLAVGLGTNAYRFSIEWSRVEPREGEHDERAASYYEKLIAACRARGLRPMVTLLHFTLPRWAAERGGWLDERTLEAFDRHAKWVAERYGPAVDLWVTVNEPNVHSGASYLSGIFPPGKLARPDLARRCERALVRAHVRAYDILHEEARKADRRCEVGIAQHAIAWKASRLSPIGLVRRWGDSFNWSFLDQAVVFDYVGINYYMALGADLAAVLRMGGLLPRRSGPGRSDLGWPIDAGGFESVLVDAHRRYRKPVIVTENGIADARDDRRPGYLSAHVEALARARRAGADIRGYFHWSLTDNFEWHEGYAPRFGLYAIDYSTQERTPRASCEVFKRLVREVT
jgi:beta-glucosidase